MKRLLLGLCGILALGVAWQWRAWPPQPPDRTPATAPPAAGVAPATDGRASQLEALQEERLPSDYLSVAERPLFQPERRPPQDEPEPAPAPAQQQAVELTGVDVMAILIAEPGVPSVWLLDKRQAPTAQRYRLGDEFQGWRISAIEPEAVQLQRQGRSEQLPLLDFNAPAPPNGQPPPRRAQPHRRPSPRRRAP